MSFVIKHQPEDFIVKELSDFELHQSGPYTCFWLTKTNHTTLGALKLISRALGISVKRLSYAGLKDKKAVTTQLCSVQGNFSQKIEKIELENISLSFAGFALRPLSLGFLKGNHFELTIRNIDYLPDLSTHTFYNYFGSQRFSEHNVLIGRLLLQKKFKEAVEYLRQKHSILSSTDGPINALQALPKKLLSIYINSYQSWLFNETLKHLVDTGSEIVDSLPLVGFGTSHIPEFMKSLLVKDGISSRDFIFRQLPYLSSEGTTRNTIGTATELSFGELEEDEFFSGKKKVPLTFDLSPGCYATQFINQKFSIIEK